MSLIQEYSLAANYQKNETPRHCEEASADEAIQGQIIKYSEMHSGLLRSARNDV